MASCSGNQETARQTLVDRLLDAVKQCQIRFGGKTELATDRDSRVSCLCAQWEAVLQFGIKSNRKLNPLRHVTGQVLLRPEGESVWWQFVKEHLSSTEIRRFSSLQNISTDAGRALSWLRSALNEQSLEKYLHSFLGNRQLLSLYYESNALLMDEERSSMLPMMAAGLSSILFAINIDNPEFNMLKQSSCNPGLTIQLVPAPLVAGPSVLAPSPTYSVVPGKEKKKRKKKKANIAIVPIENVEFEEECEQAEGQSVDENKEPKRGQTASDFLTSNNANFAGNVSTDTASGNLRTVSSMDLGTGGNFNSSTSLDSESEDRKNYGKSRHEFGVRKNYGRSPDNSEGRSDYNWSHDESRDRSGNGSSRDESATNSYSSLVATRDRFDDDKSRDWSKASSDWSFVASNSQGGNDSLRNESMTLTQRGLKEPSVSSSTSSCEGMTSKSYPLDKKGSLTGGNLAERRTSGKELVSLRLQSSGRGGISQRNEPANVGHGTTEEEPLVELSSGVSLTPVACPDEARTWALQESDVSESPGNEIRTVDASLLVTSRLFPGSHRDSPVSSGFTTDDDVSEDANSAIDATEAALSAAQDVHRGIADFTRPSLVRTMGDGRMSPPREPSNSKEMTSGELKQAIVAMMLRKDEAEERNRSLRQLLDKEMVDSAALRLQVEELKLEREACSEAHQAIVQALSSENDMLKHQLKKYVAAVQSLRRSQPVDIAVPGARQDDNLPVLPEKSQMDDSSKDMEIDFERKLIQVADMHGELIELNERLQKMLNVREHQLRRLREELVNLRGPLPDDSSRDDCVSLEDFGPRLVSVNTRPLINIWIPSAFVQGRSSSAHHTYQVYVRIKDDEWNVYRRYSHFHDLHKKICKQYRSVGTFKFPQKKVIGNRDAKFVEMRRRHLQSYLRKLINYALKIIPELSENPSKSILLKYFPFFCNTVKENSVTTPEGITQTHYTGL